MIVKRVSTPDDGLKKIAAVTAEVDKLTAALPAGNEKTAKVATLLSELKTLEAGMTTIEQRLVGKGMVLTEERMAGFEPIFQESR